MKTKKYASSKWPHDYTKYPQYLLDLIFTKLNLSKSTYNKSVEIHQYHWVVEYKHIYLRGEKENKGITSDLKLEVIYRRIETDYSFQEEARCRVTIKPSPRLFI